MYKLLLRRNGDYKVYDRCVFRPNSISIESKTIFI